MGGYGSGRHWDREAKGTTDGYRALDVRRLHREGALKPGLSYGLYWTRGGKPWGSIGVRSEDDAIVLTYRSQRSGGDWQSHEYPVYLDWTPCHFGGARPWFLCPRCGERVAILYLKADVFACRNCCRLAYASERETAEGRAIRRAERIRTKLGWGPGIANPIGGKPKHMHWETFSRLVTRYKALADAAADEMLWRLRRLTLPHLVKEYHHATKWEEP